MATRELSVSYLIAPLLLLATGIFYALSLTFSAAGERLWLKTAGAFQLLLGATMVLSFTWATLSLSAAFLFVPQCPRGYGWGGLLDQPSVDSLVFEAMAALEKEYSIDTKRR